MAEREPEASNEQADALKRALVAIRDLRGRLSEVEGRAHEPIAIVGMSCRFPGGAATPEAFWRILESGTDATIEVPADRWPVDDFYDADPDTPGRAYVRRGGFLSEPVDSFDAGFFHISPVEAATLDPIHRMLLELSWEALERAGIPPLSLADTETGVFVGLSGSDYSILQNRAPLEQIDSYRGTGTAACVASGRISYFLGLHGPNFALDTACSSGLVALVQAVESLRARHCKLALAGSGHLMLSPDATVFLCRLKALSADGRCRTYDASASGYGRGEGGAMFVLKRLGDALADGDDVHAVIRGVACNHDGQSSGLTVPNPAAQRTLIAAALRDAGLEPRQIGYVETHGTATPLGDPLELRVLSEIFGEARAADDPLLLGSVKTNFGHLEAVSGLAGLMKVVLSMQHAVIPPHLHLREPTPHVDWAAHPLRVVTEPTPWPNGSGTRRAGISAFGFSGTNAHVIIEQAPVAAAEDPRPSRPCELIALSGGSPAAVRELAGRYRALLRSSPRPSLADLAVTSMLGRSHLALRAYATGSDPESMDASLRAVEESAGDGIVDIRSAKPGSMCFMFTGQGAQYPAMARELADSSAVFRRAIERCAEIVDPELEEPLLPMLTGNVDPGCLNRTAYAQPALFAVEYALAELWRSWGVEPAYVVGHSLGEFTAAAIAGIFDVEDALRLVARRGRLMQSLPGGGKMAAALAGEDRVRAALDGLGDVAIAALNSPESTVISGAAEAVEQAVERLERQGVSSQYLEVSHAFHSALMEPMLDAFEREVAALRMNAPRIPLVSNLSGELMTDDEATDPARWRRHAREPVRFAQSIRTLVGLGVRSFVEVGPHPTLCGLARATVRDHDIYLIPSLRRGVTAWQPLLDSVGTLYGIGYELEWQGLAREHAGRRTVGPTYPFQRKRHWFDVGRSSRPQALGAPPGAAAAHPLLGVSIDSPALRGRAFEITLTPRQPAYLAEHAVGDSVLTPGAVFVEMLAAAGREALGSDRVRLDRVRFEHPLFVSDDGVRCQVTVTEPRDGGAEALVSSGKAGPRGRIDWTRHASCTVQSSPAPESAPDELANLRRHVTAPIDVAALFDRIAARGIQHGPSFRALREAWSGPTGALGRAELHADSAAGAGYAGVHPCLLDSGLQLLECLSGDDVGSDATFLPAGIDEIRWYSAAGRCVWIHGSIRDQGPEPDPDLLLADLRFFDEEGRLVVDLVGFRARNVHLEPTRRADAASASVLTVGWEEIDAPSAPQPGTGVWLVLEDRSRVAAAVAAEIERRGGRVVRVRRGGAWAHEADGFTVDPDQPGQLARVMEASGLTGGAALTGLLHFWTLDRPDAVERSAAAVQREVLDGLSPLLDVVQSSSAWRGRIGLVTRGAAGDIGSRSASAWQAGAALWGAISVLQAEYPESLCRVLDLDPAVLSYEAGAILDAVLGDSAEDRLVVRDGKLLAPRLSALHEPSGEDLRRLPGSSYRIQIHQRGTLDGISYVRMPRVDPGPGEVEVRVRCTGLNFRDVLNVLGMYPGDPGDPGNEFAGVVTRLGPGVTGLAEGDAVIGIGSATFAAYTIEPAAAVVRQPRGLSMVEAATIPLVFLTAEYGLMRLAGLNSGERVLIHAAAGGVGQAAVQIAQAAGAEVFATAGSDAKRDFLRAQGVRQVFSSRDPAFADEVFAATKGEGVDVVLNALTGPMLKRSLELLRPGGRFLEMGKAEVLDPAEVSATYSGVRYEAFDLGALLLSDPVAFQQMFLRLVERFESGELEPLHVRTFEAERIVDALRYMAQARHIGKVVVSGGRLAAADDPVIRSDGVYLVTGATGGVARAVVEWLVRRGAGSIVLSARSAPDDERAHWLDALRAEGARIDWVAGDVTSQADTAALIAAAVDTGLPLRGAFHLAGVLDDGLMADQTRDRFDRVLAPKVAGAWHLCQAVRRFELDHFVLFSSIAGVLGGAGQLSYSAANAVLGTLAEQLTREGISAVAIDWGAWDGPGMAAGISEPIRRRLIESGSGFVRPEAAIELMESVLSGSEAHVLIAQIDWQRLAASVRKAPPLLAHLLDGGAAVRASDNGGQRKPEQQTGADEPHTPMEQTIADLWRKLLKVDYVSVHDTFFDLGGDSLLSAEFVTMLEKAIGLRVDPADVIVQTLQQLAAVCEEKAPISAAPPQRQGTFVRRLLNQIKRTVS